MRKEAYQLVSTVATIESFLPYVCAKLPQLCPILCDPMDCSPPGSSVHGILQARILKWVALLQGIFLTQGLNSGLLPWQADFLPSETYV